MTAIPSAWSSWLDEPPSCVAFCPQRADIVTVGTYLLHGQGNDEAKTSESQQRRTGSLILYHCQNLALHCLQTVSINSAILDIEWSPHVNEHGDLLAVATSTGSLELYRLEQDHLTLSSRHQIGESDILVLDLLWHPVLPNIIGVTLSDGNVALCSIRPTSSWPNEGDSKLDIITSHTLEPWTLAFSSSGNEIYSGGDDAVLQSCNIDDLESPLVLWRNRKQHSAGVTSILPLSDSLCLTGSYDDHIRLLQMPVQGSKSVLAELDLGGGVWRMKLVHSHIVAGENESSDGSLATEHSTGDVAGRMSYTILVSCMHAGARIIELRHHQADSLKLDGDERKADAWHFEVKARFTEHESMNYGSDVQPRRDRNDKVTIVSSSFYDRRICLWQYDRLAQ